MMKRRLVCLWVLAVACAGLVFGTGAASPFSIGRGMTHQVQPGVNYNFFAAPQMMAADQTFVYLIDMEFGEARLVVINRTNGRTHTQSAPLAQMPEHIQVEGGMLFLFFSNHYRVVRTSDIVGTPPNFADAAPVSFTLEALMIGGQFFYSSAIEIWTTFNVIHLAGTGTFRIMFASGNVYRLRVFDSEALTQGEAIPGGLHTSQRIAGITSTQGGAIFLLASSPIAPTHFFIYEEGNQTALSQTFFHNPTSFNTVMIGDDVYFLLIASGRIVLYNPLGGMPHQENPNLANTEDFYTHLSYDPIFLSARGPNEIFVIDAKKSSIDQYRVTGGQPIFYRTVAASIGDNFGFFNHPTDLAIIGEDRLLVTDHSANIRFVDRSTDAMPSTFLNRSQHDLGIPGAIAFDNYQSVFIYDFNRVHRIQRFTFDPEAERPTGTRVGEPITTFTAGAVTNQIGAILQLLVDPVTQILYVLDSDNRQIYRLIDDRLVLVAAPFEVTWSTRAVINSDLNMMFLINTSTGHVAMCLDTFQTRPIIGLDFGADFNLHDITVDTLYNPIVMAVIPVIGRNPRVFINHFKIAELTPDFIRFVPSFTHEELHGATAGRGLGLDRLNGTLYWTGTRHAIEGTAFRTDADAAHIWSFRYHWRQDAHGNWSHRDRPHYDWSVPHPPMRAPEPNDRPLFALTSATRDTTIFKYPNSINAIFRLPRGQAVQIIQHDVVFTDLPAYYNFNYVKVIFQDYGQNHFFAGYVNKRFLDFDFVYSVDKNVFDPDSGREFSSNSGRVLIDTTWIFKYPASLGYSVRIGRLRTNHTHPNSSPEIDGLEIVRRIMIPDIRNWHFYEIRVDENGNADPKGLYAGFVWTQHVIYWHEPQQIGAFNPNARIILPRGITLAQIYHDENGIEEFEGQALEHNRRVRIVYTLDRSRPYTYIEYYNAATGRLMTGYVETRFLVPDGLTPWQLVGIILASVGGILAIFFTVKHFIKKRRQP